MEANPTNVFRPPKYGLVNLVVMAHFRVMLIEKIDRKILGHENRFLKYEEVCFVI